MIPKELTLPETIAVLRDMRDALTGRQGQRLRLERRALDTALALLLRADVSASAKERPE